jgi:hypothetical protein
MFLVVNNIMSQVNVRTLLHINVIYLIQYLLSEFGFIRNKTITI